MTAIVTAETSKVITVKMDLPMIEAVVAEGQRRTSTTVRPRTRPARIS